MENGALLLDQDTSISIKAFSVAAITDFDRFAVFSQTSTGANGTGIRKIGNKRATQARCYLPPDSMHSFLHAPLWKMETPFK